MFRFIHKEGYAILIIFLVMLLGLNVAIRYFLPQDATLHVITFLVSLGGLGFVMYFFRNPKRMLYLDEGAIIAPADGKIVVVEETEETEYFGDRRLQVSIFMNVNNVHVNRTPMTGQVKYFRYHPGKYLVAWHPKSSTENERTTVVIEDTDDQVEVLMRQIAGTVARRIKFYIDEGAEVEQGAEFGFIKFGSRVDLFLPLHSELEVSVGQKVTGGQTVIARIPRND